MGRSSDKDPAAEGFGLTEEIEPIREDLLGPRENSEHHPAREPRRRASLVGLTRENLCCGDS